MLPEDLTRIDLEERMQSIDWEHAFYDPLYFNTEATEPTEIAEVKRLEALIWDLQKIAGSGLQGQKLVEELTSKYWKERPIGDLINYLFNHKKPNIMNEQNFEYLKDNIKYMGFGDGLNDALEMHLKQAQPEFTISIGTQVNKKPFDIDLHFRKSSHSDMYFFNSYNASLQRSNGEKIDQTFYLSKGRGMTAKEAYNMLEGRAVFKELTTKEGQPYKAWVQLDFDNKDKHNNHEVKQFHENYGYDLKGTAAKFAIVELNDPEKEKLLLQSLQKGNIQSVSIEKDGNVSKMFIEANPQFKTVTLYDAQMKRMQREELSKYHSARQLQSKEVKPDQNVDLKQDSKKAVKQTVGDDLSGVKKKTSRKKGLSV